MDTTGGSSWRKSTYSGGGGSTECVEAGTDHGAILIRDTTNRNGGTLEFTAKAWTTYTRDLKQA